MLSKLKLCCVFVALAAFTIGQAMATGTPTPPTPSPQPTTSTSSAEAAAAAAAKAKAGASASAQQGQQQGQGQDQGQQQTGGTLSDSSSSSSRMYVLPSPVFTPPMAAVQCPTPRIENRALSIGWGFLSVARGDTITDDCTAIAMRNAYVEQCQYASAKQVQDLLSARALPGFKASGTVYLDLTRAECDALRAPPPAPTEVRYITILPTPDVKLHPVPAKPAKKRVRTAIPCEREQVAKQVWQCKAKR